MPIRPLFAALLSLLAVPSFGAQSACPGLESKFGRAGSANDVGSAVTFDDGNGPALYVTRLMPRASDFGDVPGIARWDGTRWVRVAGTFEHMGPFGTPATGSLYVFDDGTGPALYAAGTFTHVGGVSASNIARWNGTSWSAVGAGVPFPVRELISFDDGTGPALYAGGAYTLGSGWPGFALARWNGTSWTSMGTGHGGDVNSFTTFDDGTGEALYVGGGPYSFGISPEPTVARWNGSSWAPAGSTHVDVGLIVTTLTVHDDGSGAKLHAGGSPLISFPPVSGITVARLTNGTWEPVGGGTLTSVSDLLSFHDGNSQLLLAACANVGLPHPLGSMCLGWNGSSWQPFATPISNGSAGIGDLSLRQTSTGNRLLVTGRFLVDGAQPVENIAEWDGTRWYWPGHGVEVGGPAAWYDDGTGPTLHVFASYSFPQHPTVFRQWLRWTPTGWSELSTGANDEVRAVLEFDDGSGPSLFAAGLFTNVGGAAANHIAKWNGTSWSDVGGGTNGHVYALAVHDDGSGPALYAAGKFTTAGGTACQSIARWNGTSWTPLGAGISTLVSNEGVFALASFPGGLGGAAGLYAGGQFASPTRLGRWDGSTWHAVGGAPNHRVRTLEVVDEGPAGYALYCGGRFTAIGIQTLHRIARWNGSTWSALGTGPGFSQANEVLDIDRFDFGQGLELCVTGDLSSFENRYMGIQAFDGVTWRREIGRFDLRAEQLLVTPEPDGAKRLTVTGGFRNIDGGEHFTIAQFVGCRPELATFCAGDGVDPFVVDDCPCSNFGAPGRGCAWSANPQGALLATSGAQNPDTLVLHATGMPAVAPQTVFWKSDTHLVGGTPWGDGVRCITGNLIRLGTKTNVGGAAEYPQSGNAPISVRGQTPPGSGLVGYYQTTFRNAASFCTPNTYNATNGVIVVW